MPDSLLPVSRPATGDILSAKEIARGAMRLLADHGYAVVQEFPLRVKRRADLIGINDAGEIVILEIKSSRADFRADHKWHEYLGFCDRFFFAVATSFPQDILPADCGLIVADRHGGAVIRQAPAMPLNVNRRRAQILRIALCASQRLTRATTPAD